MVILFLKFFFNSRLDVVCYHFDYLLYLMHVWYHGRFSRITVSCKSYKAAHRDTKHFVAGVGVRHRHNTLDTHDYGSPWFWQSTVIPNIICSTDTSSVQHVLVFDTDITLIHVIAFIFLKIIIGIDVSVSMIHSKHNDSLQTCTYSLHF